jgi:hypothetical protein
VLRPERGQPEFPGYEPAGYLEVFRNKQLIGHPAIVTPPVAAAGAGGDGRS